MNTANIKLSIRNLLKNKLNSTIIILSLSLGLGAMFIISSWAVFEYSYDNFHRNKNRIYRVLDHQTFIGQDEQYLAQVPEYLVNTFEDEIPGIELSTILLHTGNFLIGEGQNIVEISDVYYSESNLFEVFSIKFITGNPKTCLSIGKAVITQQTAIKLFGKANPIGKTIKRGINNYLVSAVIEDLPVNTHLKFSMLLPIDERKPHWDVKNGNHNASVYVLLKKGINPVELSDNLHHFTNRHFTRNPDKYNIELQPLSDLHLNSGHTIWEMNKNKFNGTYVLVIILIAFLLVLIAAINSLNLTLVGFSKRKKEIGIRKINGSRKPQIVRQFLFEHFMLAGLACVLATLIIAYSFPYLRTNFLGEYQFNDLINVKTIFICLVMLTLLVLATGLFPSLSYSVLSPVSVLKGNITKKLKQKSFSQILVLSQLIVTTFLIIVSLGIFKQMRYIRNKDLGLKTEQVLVLPSVENMNRNYPILKEELLKNPDILNVTASNRVVGEDFWRNTLKFEGQDPESRYVIPFLIVDNNFPEFYEIEPVQGHLFSKEATGDSAEQVFVINESLARELGFKDPIGKKMRFSHTPMGEIIGVVKDFHFQTLHKPIEPMAFYRGSEELYEISVKINPASANRILPFIEKTWKSFSPNYLYRYQFLDDQFAQLYGNDTKTTKLVLIFTILCIIISSLGLFGLISFVSEQKTKEIGVRKVNGAKISEIMAMLNKNYFVWGIVGFIIASPIGYYAVTKWLENFAYKTDLSWWIFAVAGAIALVIALVTVSLQSWRAATRNPVESLRYE